MIKQTQYLDTSLNSKSDPGNKILDPKLDFNSRLVDMVTERLKETRIELPQK